MLAEVINIKKAQYPDWLDVDLWSEYVEHRKEIKRPMSERAERMALRKLKRLIDSGGDQNEILENAVMNGWQGLFMPDNGRSNLSIPPATDHAALDKYAAAHNINTKGCNDYFALRQRCVEATK